MDALWIQVSAWLGYLDRWTVSWQIAFILCVAIAAAFARRITPFVGKTQIPTMLLGPLTLISTGVLFQLTPMPSGIIRQVAFSGHLSALSTGLNQA